MKQNVSRESRLTVMLNLRFPNINRKKLYNDSSRRYRVYSDGVELFSINQHDQPSRTIDTKLCSQIVVTKSYGDKKPDSTFTFIVRENFAILTNQSGHQKRVELDFLEGNIVNILDDNDFNSAVDISR